MNPHKFPRLLPHEVFFGLMLVILWARLAFVAGFPGGYTLFYAVAILLNVAAIRLARSQNPMRQRLGLLYYPVFMNLVFMSLKGSIPLLHPGRMDASLHRIDSMLIGTNLSIRLQPFVHPVFTEFFSFCYILFFPYLLFGMVMAFVGDLELLKRFCVGLFSIYGIGFLGYSLVPAAGPYVAMADQYTVSLDGWWITHWNAAIVARGSNGVDVFPSLHCAVSSFLLFFDRRHRPWRFRIYLVPCVGLWLSTIYLRYHYLIDIVCGFALSAFALWLCRRYSSKTPAPSQTHHEIYPGLP